jgi:cytochrome c
MLASILLFAACKQREVSGDPDRGRQLVEQYSCPACHVIPGVEGPRGMIGPPLDHIATRPRIAEKIENTPATMAKWIQNPQSFDPANTMPALGINDADARDITAYLFTLK